MALSKFVFTLAIVGASFAPPPAAAPSPAQTGAPDVLLTAVRSLAVQRAGVVAFRRHDVAQEYGPGHDGSLDEQSGILTEDGKLIGSKVYSRIVTAQDPATGDLPKAQMEADKHVPDDAYALPLREEHLADYAFAGTTCDRCPAGDVAVRFTSLKRDASHGDGIAVIDPNSGHFVRLDFAPSVFPKYVDRATATIAFGRALPDLWDVVEMQQHYSGHFLFISGGADITTTLRNYSRFASRDEGSQALASGL